MWKTFLLVSEVSLAFSHAENKTKAKNNVTKARKFLELFPQCYTAWEEHMANSFCGHFKLSTDSLGMFLLFCFPNYFLFVCEIFLINFKL